MYHDLSIRNDVGSVLKIRMDLHIALIKVVQRCVVERQEVSRARIQLGQVSNFWSQKVGRCYVKSLVVQHCLVSRNADGTGTGRTRDSESERYCILATKLNGASRYFKTARVFVPR